MSSRNSPPPPLSIPRQRSTSLGGAAFGWPTPLSPTTPVSGIASSPTATFTSSPFGVGGPPVVNSSPPSSLGRRFSASFGVNTPKVFTPMQDPFAQMLNSTMSSSSAESSGHHRDISSSSTSSVSSITGISSSAILSRFTGKINSAPERPASPMGNMILQGQLLD